MEEIFYISSRTTLDKTFRTEYDAVSPRTYTSSPPAAPDATTEEIHCHAH